MFQGLNAFDVLRCSVFQVKPYGSQVKGIAPFGGEQMQIVRRIQTVDTTQLSIKIPKSFVHKQLEILVMPVENVNTMSDSADWPPHFFARTAGCFSETPLVREDQGAYEVRDTIK